MATGHFYKTAADVVASLTNVAGSMIAVLDEVLDIAAAGYGGTLGWEQPFPTVGNVAVYRATTGNRAYLRVSDTSAETATLLMYRTMTDLNTGIGPCPNGSPQSTGWCRVQKADEGGDHHFIVAGDSRYFAMFTRHDNIGSYLNYCPFIFGDIQSFDPLDVGYQTILCAAAESTGGAQYNTYRRSMLDIHTTGNMEASSSYIGSVDNTGTYMLGSVDGLILSSTSLIHDPFNCSMAANKGRRGMAHFGSSPALVYAPFYILDMNGSSAQTMQYGGAFRGSNAYLRGTLPYVYSTPYAGYTGMVGEQVDGASTFTPLTYIQTQEQTGTSYNSNMLLLRTSDDEPGRTF